MMDKNFAGLDGFVWWMGIVESRLDPLALGRCQVRIFGWHSSSLADIPTKDLPWAHPVNSLNNNSFATPKEADLVFGFFADGRNAQVPIMLGVLPNFNGEPADKLQGFHDVRSLTDIRFSPKKPVSRTYNSDGTGIKVGEANTADPAVLESLRYPHSEDLDRPSVSGVTRYDLSEESVVKARKENLDKSVTTADGVVWSEPYPAYSPIYPFNQAIETESGHVFELDDSPRNERIAMTHRSGTYWEMYPSGSKVEKITKSNYQIIMSDDHLHVMGRAHITVDSDCFIKVLGDVKLEAGNDLDAKVSGSMNLSVGENFNIKAKTLNVDVENDIDLVSGGDQYLSSGGDTNITGSGVNLDASSSMNLKGSKVKMGGGATVDILGAASVSIDGASVRIKKGALSPSGASSASAAGIESAGGRETKNDPPRSQERIPVPSARSTFAKLDAETGLAVKLDNYAVENPADIDGDKIEPPAPASPQSCDFTEAGKIFLSPSAWTLGRKGLDLIKVSEGFAKAIGANQAQGYPDPATGGEPITIGYGSTGPAVDQKITLSTIISRTTAEEYLAYSVNKKFLPSLRQYITRSMTQEMVDACLSLIYNIGPGNFAKSTVRKRINEGDWCGAAEAFLAWNKAAGKVLPALTKRRKAERALFLT